jgi:hypothetical protein
LETPEPRVEDIQPAQQIKKNWPTQHQRLKKHPQSSRQLQGCRTKKKKHKKGTEYYFEHWFKTQKPIKQEFHNSIKHNYADQTN